MGYETIRFDRKGPVGVLTLNRPGCLNAINHVMRAELTDFLKARLDDTEVRVIVITGQGRGFCAGLDLKDPVLLGEGSEASVKKAYESMQKPWSEIVLLMRRGPQPYIGAINGPAAGGGFSIALACDLRLAAPEARFSAAFINIGFGGADMGSSWFFPRAVGQGNAARYLLTGDLFDADEALRIGLVQQVVDKDRLLEEAMKVARTMASKSPLGLRLTKEALNHSAGGVSLEDAILLEDRNQVMCMGELKPIK